MTDDPCCFRVWAVVLSFSSNECILYIGGKRKKQDKDSCLSQLKTTDKRSKRKRERREERKRTKANHSGKHSFTKYYLLLGHRDPLISSQGSLVHRIRYKFLFVQYIVQPALRTRNFYGASTISTHDRMTRGGGSLVRSQPKKRKSTVGDVTGSQASLKMSVVISPGWTVGVR